MNAVNLTAPTGLAQARDNAHAAVQLLYRAAIANIAPMPAEEHTNLGWVIGGGTFQTHALANSELKADLRLSPLTLVLGTAQLPLDGVTIEDAVVWLDAQLDEHCLKPASATAVTYDLPQSVTALSTFSDHDDLAALALWFDLAARIITDLAASASDIDPGPSPVRCWPHHFDLATYVSLEEGDAEAARGVGVGLSPGDGSYDEPYFYVNPWPHLDITALPDPVAPGHWHTAGFVGLVCTATELLQTQEPTEAAQSFVMSSFAVSRSSLM
ncbi:MAG: hypothetical protein AAF940_08100 [Pseudomonadota bacterium]